MTRAAAIRADEMTWTDFTCPVARALDLVGDRWSLLIIRDVMFGNRRHYSELLLLTGIQ